MDKEQTSMAAALAALASGIAMCFLGFFMSPEHEMGNSVLFHLGEMLVFAGSILGLKNHIDYKTGRVEKSSPPDVCRESTIRDDLTVGLFGSSAPSRGGSLFCRLSFSIFPTFGLAKMAIVACRVTVPWLWKARRVQWTKRWWTTRKTGL